MFCTFGVLTLGVLALVVLTIRCFDTRCFVPTPGFGRQEEMEFFEAGKLSLHVGQNLDFLEPSFDGLHCPCSRLCS